ncbi:pyrroline-5-carboxylate reductase [Sphingomonas qilianensis]|uniref:Pyrroline-5-carboxylate reductase n=1 Tax=Sphingomonas qilianensis TaxID=1736690 RepID=A0ABU9XSC0_9SPHN
MRLWLIGCGNMAGAMLRRWIDSGVVAAVDVDVVNRADRALPDGVRQARDLPEGPLPDLVMLGMKPQQIDEIVQRFAGRIAGVPILVSILAGVEEMTLAARFSAGAVVRAMPNLPVAIGKGVVALQSDSAGPDARAAVAALMAPLGLVEWVEAKQFDAITALAGSGPAFLYRFIDALGAAGVSLGLGAEQAQRLALATVEGAGLMAAASDHDVAELAERVASPGGSTRAGLNVLDQEDALAGLLRDTLAAAERRNAEMAAAAR